MDQLPQPNGESTERLSRRRMFLAVFLFAVVTRAVCLTDLLISLPFYHSTLAGSDPHTYRLWALAIARGDVLSRNIGVFQFAPLYPYVLSVVYLVVSHADVIAGVVLNGIFGVATALMAAALADRVFGRRAGLAAGLLLALSGAHLSIEGVLLQDALIALLLIAGLWLFVRGLPEPEERPRDRLLYWIWPGLLIGLAGVARSTNLLVGVALCSWLLVRSLRTSGSLRTAGGATLALAVAVGLTGLPAARNGLLFGRWTPPEGGWRNLYIGTEPDYGGVVVYTARFQEAAARADAAEDPARAWRAELWKLIRENPKGVAGVAGLKLTRLLDSTDLPDNVNYYFVRRYVPSFTLTVGPVVLYALGLAGVAISFRRFRKLMPLYLFGLSFILSLVPSTAMGRFKLPLLCLCCVFGGQTIAALWIWLADKHWRPAAATIGLVGLLLVVCWPRGPWGVSFAENTLRTWEFRQLADSLQANGCQAKAVAVLEDAEELFPNDLTFVCRLIAADLDTGQTSQAIRRVEKRLRRTDPHLAEGSAALRVAACKEILRLMPDHSQVNSVLVESDKRFPDELIFCRILVERDLQSNRVVEAIERIGRKLPEAPAAATRDLRETQIAGYIMLKRFPEARAALSELLRLFPESDYAKELKQAGFSP